MVLLVLVTTHIIVMVRWVASCVVVARGGVSRGVSVEHKAVIGVLTYVRYENFKAQATGNKARQPTTNTRTLNTPSLNDTKMKLNVSITAGKISQDIVVHVGDGSQTFKWLALTASHRLVSDGARKGRHLPLNAGRHSLPLRTRLLPKDVYTANCPFLHPEDIINSHLSDEDTVNVDLYMPLEFDDFGAPILSKWAFIAFRHHEQHQEKRESTYSFHFIFA